jgi:hypothetical protein
MQDVLFHHRSTMRNLEGTVEVRTSLLVFAMATLLDEPIFTCRIRVATCGGTCHSSRLDTKFAMLTHHGLWIEF